MSLPQVVLNKRLLRISIASYFQSLRSSRKYRSETINGSSILDTPSQNIKFSKNLLEHNRNLLVHTSSFSIQKEICRAHRTEITCNLTSKKG